MHLDCHVPALPPPRRKATDSDGFRLQRLVTRRRMTGALKITRIVERKTEGKILRAALVAWNAGFLDLVDPKCCRPLARNQFLFGNIIPAKAIKHPTECGPTEVVVNTFSRTVAAIAIAGCCCIAGSVAPASRAALSPDLLAFGQTAQVESVTGRITTVAGNTFTVQSSSRDGRKPVTITVDQDSVVRGRIAVGLTAHVTFRREDRNNIAVSVRTSHA
jgi:hypothetical protein